MGWRAATLGRGWRTGPLPVLRLSGGSREPPLAGRLPATPGGRAGQAPPRAATPSLTPWRTPGGPTPQYLDPETPRTRTLETDLGLNPTSHLRRQRGPSRAESTSSRPKPARLRRQSELSTLRTAKPSLAALHTRPHYAAPYATRGSAMPRAGATTLGSLARDPPQLRQDAALSNRPLRPNPRARPCLPLAPCAYLVCSRMHHPLREATGSGLRADLG